MDPQNFFAHGYIAPVAATSHFHLLGGLLSIWYQKHKTDQIAFPGHTGRKLAIEVAFWESLLSLNIVSSLLIKHNNDTFSLAYP